jgi:hypothetical protein
MVSLSSISCFAVAHAMARDIPWRQFLPVRAAVAVALAAVVVAASLLVAARRVPPFYRQALTCDAIAARRASQEMGSLATALLNQTRKPGRWNGLFTTAQINGWLAVDLTNHQRQLLAEGIGNPRVAIDGDRVQIGFHWRRGGMETVGSVELGVSLIEPNVVAFRLYAARAGCLPLPQGSVIERISQLASRAEIPLYWTQTDGDPVAIVTLPPGDLGDDRQIWLERLELHDGQIQVTGHTRKAAHLTEAIQPSTAQPEPAERDAKNSNRQWH